MLRKTWRENFFVLVPQVFISRAKTKKFTRVFFRIYEPQSRHFRFENQVSNKPQTSIAPLCDSKSVTGRFIRKQETFFLLSFKNGKSVPIDWHKSFPAC
ncbi:hypothetical protein HMPREF1990_01376 [Porphyromonas gingivalis W4087]|nr:hypothetical protein CS544_05775 [Porphyromonas gingivalis]ERJ88337.1 hypothetical protein HMPREF1990_01376 [Porphyromonas gingivalis W4087]PDP46826.1 hypothetical protein CLI82_05100 [Porphyromonas gingivalis]PDP62633.1 hypothetical protein CLI83_04405 [Porphyromonas gingivalis]PDP78084.1 hypothetical protein CLI76_00575 [Porphyromonas gingivalis]